MYNRSYDTNRGDILLYSFFPIKMIYEYMKYMCYISLYIYHCAFHCSGVGSHSNYNGAIRSQVEFWG